MKIQGLYSLFLLVIISIQVAIAIKEAKGDPIYVTKEELKKYDGSDPNLPIYLAVKGMV